MASPRGKAKARGKVTDVAAKKTSIAKVGAGGAGIAPVVAAGSRSQAAQRGAAGAVAGKQPAADIAPKISGKIGVSGVAVKTVLTNLSGLLANIIQANQPSVPLPPRILGSLRQPDETPGNYLQIEVLPPPASKGAAATRPAIFGANTSGSQVVATGLTDSVGNFSMALPPGVVLPPGAALTFRVRGSSPAAVVPMSADPNLLGPTGYLGTMSLPHQLAPIPAEIFQELQQTLSTADGTEGTGDATTPPAIPKLLLGDDQDCIRVLENQISFEQFPYGIFFQLIAPNLYSETETINANRQQSPPPISCRECCRIWSTTPSRRRSSPTPACCNP